MDEMEMERVCFLVAEIHQSNDRLEADDGQGDVKVAHWIEGVIPSSEVPPFFLRIRAKFRLTSPG